MSLLWTSNRFTSSSIAWIVNFEQENSGWDDNDNNNDDNSPYDDVDRTDFTMNLF